MVAWIIELRIYKNTLFKETAFCIRMYQVKFWSNRFHSQVGNYQKCFRENMFFFSRTAMPLFETKNFRVPFVVFIFLIYIHKKNPSWQFIFSLKFHSSIQKRFYEQQREKK
jgi:hypothetical protein